MFLGEGICQVLPLANGNGSKISFFYCNVNLSDDLVSVGMQPIESRKNKLSARRHFSFLAIH